MNVTLLLFLIASSVLAIVHIISLELYLYWRYLWLDIPMHILGGSVISLGICAMYSIGIKLPKRWLCLLPVLSFVIIVALCWEVYEIAIGISIDDDYIIDTIVDLTMGITGGVIGYFVGTRMASLEA